MSATFRITQNAVAGEYGIARQDLTLFSVGGTITLEAQDQTGGSSDYVWEVLSEPAGSSATITTPTPAAPWIVEVDLTVTGGYLFRLVFKPGSVDEDISILYLGIPLAGSGLCIPALNETIFDNSYAAGGSGDTYVGYERKANAFRKWMDANVSGTPVSSTRVFVDAENGSDVTGDGSNGSPYATLAFAASEQPDPTTDVEFGTEILFQLEPGVYTGDVTLPYRSGVSITGELVFIAGDIYWNHDPDMFFGYTAQLYGNAALKISGGASNPILIAGDIIAQNVNPSASVRIGDKYFIANRMVVAGSFMNLAAGASTSSNEASGAVHTIWDLVQFIGGTGTAIFAEGEPGTYGKNQIYLQARNSFLVTTICGNIELDHLVGVGLLAIDYTTGRPGGVSLTAYAGNVGGSKYYGALGVRNCVNLNSAGTFDFGKDASNTYTLEEIQMDSASYAAMNPDSSYTNFAADPVEFVDSSYGVATYAKSWSGNLSDADTTVQAALTTLNNLSLDPGKITLSKETSNATAVALTVDTGTLDTATSTVYYGDMMLAAKETDAAGTPGGLKSWAIRFTARSDADGNTEVLAPVDVTVINSTSISDENTWGVDSISIDEAGAGDPIEIYVVGGASTVHWAAEIRMVTLDEGGAPQEG